MVLCSTAALAISTTPSSPTHRRALAFTSTISLHSRKRCRMSPGACRTSSSIARAHSPTRAQRTRPTSWALSRRWAHRGPGIGQRVLHPEASESGPCEECIADSAIVHPITEAFTEFHPHGVCSAQSILFYFTSKPAKSVRIPYYGMPTQNIIRRLPIGSLETT